MRLYHWGSRRTFMPIHVISCALTTCDYCAKCKSGSSSVTNTLSEERVSNDKEGRRFYHLTAGANMQDFCDFYTNAATLCMLQ